MKESAKDIGTGIGKEGWMVMRQGGGGALVADSGASSVYTMRLVGTTFV